MAIIRSAGGNATLRAGYETATAALAGTASTEQELGALLMENTLIADRKIFEARAAMPYETLDFLTGDDRPNVLAARGWTRWMAGQGTEAIEPWRIVSRTSPPRAGGDGSMRRWLFKRPSSDFPPAAVKASSESLARWVATQRTAYLAGRMSAAKIILLDALDGWQVYPQQQLLDENWRSTLAALTAATGDIPRYKNYASEPERALGCCFTPSINDALKARSTHGGWRPWILRCRPGTAAANTATSWDRYRRSVFRQVVHHLMSETTSSGLRVLLWASYRSSDWWTGAGKVSLVRSSSSATVIW